MNESYTIKFLKLEWLPVSRDGYDCLIFYSYVPTALIGKPEEEFNTHKASIFIGISGTLATLWGLRDNVNDLEKVLFEYAKRYLEEKAEEKALGGVLRLELTTYNSPNKRPFNPSHIHMDFKKSYAMNVPVENPITGADSASLPSLIVDLRDSINAIFAEKFGNGKILLKLPQERNLVELFKECKDHETFAYRAASIGGLATGMSLSLKEFGTFLRETYPDKLEQTNKVMDVLTNFNKLRRLYPVHSDRADGVLKAHQFFNIDYPVRDHSFAGRRLLEAYRDVLEQLLGLLKLDPNK